MPDARFYGSLGRLRLNKPIVGMTATPDGRGYTLAASDGGIFTFGDARFYGSLGSIHLAHPITAMTASPSGHGYWMVGRDGHIYAFGDAAVHGSPTTLKAAQPVIALSATATGSATGWLPPPERSWLSATPLPTASPPVTPTW